MNGSYEPNDLDKLVTIFNMTDNLEVEKEVPLFSTGVAQWRGLYLWTNQKQFNPSFKRDQSTERYKCRNRESIFVISEFLISIFQVPCLCSHFFNQLLQKIAETSSLGRWNVYLNHSFKGFCIGQLAPSLLACTVHDRNIPEETPLTPWPQWKKREL